MQNLANAIAACRPRSEASMNPQALALTADDFANALARRCARSGVDLDDALQEARLAALLAAGEWRPEGGSSFRTFAFLNIRWRLARLVQKSRRHGLSGGLHTSVHVAPPSSLDAEDAEGLTAHNRLGVPANQEDQAVRDATLAAAVGALPGRVQRVVILVLEGRSYHEIAGTIGTGESNVRLLVSKAYELLGSKWLESRIGARRRSGSQGEDRARGGSTAPL